MKTPKIKPTSSDKVHGELVKYRKGDCISVKHENNYLAVLISEKFNKYYDFTLLEYFSQKQPSITDFTKGRFFGTRFGSWEDLTFAVDKQMIECRYTDNNPHIEIIGKLELMPGISKASYAYIKDIRELVNYYHEELPVRKEKSENAEKFPDLAFVSKHLVEMRHIIQ